jgi:hypothetical protein
MNKQIAPTQPKPLAPKPNDDAQRRAALEKAMASLPQKALTAPGNSIEEMVGKIFAKGHVMKPGEATHVIGLLPNDKRDNFMRVAILYEKAKEMGKYGAPLIIDLAKRINMPLWLLVRICEALLQDNITQRVSAKRGNDAQRDIPPLNRRDHIEAALMAHSGG